MIIKKGAPGGCPTSILKADEMNSPQSQKLAVGSMVERYTKEAIRKITHPEMVLMRLYLFISDSFFDVLNKGKKMRNQKIQ